MRKFSILEESIWSDIQDRSTGETERKEDDVNLLDLNEFYKYIKDQYKTKVEYIDLDAMGGGNGDVLGVDITEDIILFYKPKRGHILLSWSKVKIPMPFFDELTDRFKIENPNAMRRIITEKDGSCTNKTFVDAIEFFLGHKESMMNESIWSDLQDRSSGEQVRKEDEYDVEDNDIKKYVKICVSHFVDYVVYQDRYDKSPESFLDCIKKGDRVYGGLGLMHDRKHNQFVDPKAVLPKFIETHWETGECYKSYVNQCILDEEKKVRDTGFVKKPGESISDTLSKWFEENASELGEDFADEVEEYNATYHSEGGSRYTDLGIEDWWDDLKYIEQIEIYQEYMKKTNESIWSDIQDRSTGETVRKEDELTEKDRKDLDTLIVSYGNEVVYGRGMGTEACNLDDFCDYIETDNEIKDMNKDKILQYVKDYWADEVCDSVDGAIEQAQLEYHQDMNESIWSDIQDRSTGDVVRKEDEVLSDMEINSLNQFTLMYCRGERAKYIMNHIVPPPPSGRKENDYEGLIKYIENQRDENLFTNVGDYDKILRYIKKNWDKLDMDKYIKEHIFSPKKLVDPEKLVECEGVPGGATPTNVGGMGAAYFPGPNGEPGSGDLPSPTGVVYHQVAPYTMFLKGQKKKKKKKKFRIEDEPCAHSKNSKTYNYVDDFREYVDRTYNNIDRRK